MTHKQTAYKPGDKESIHILHVPNSGIQVFS